MTDRTSVSAVRPLSSLTVHKRLSGGYDGFWCFFGLYLHPSLKISFKFYMLWICITFPESRVTAFKGPSRPAISDWNKGQGCQHISPEKVSFFFAGALTLLSFTPALHASKFELKARMRNLNFAQIFTTLSKEIDLICICNLSALQHLVFGLHFGQHIHKLSHTTKYE